MSLDLVFDRAHTFVTEKVPLGNYCKLKNGFAFKSNSYKDKGTPVIRISDINDGVVDLEHSVKVEDSSEYNSYLICENDILVAMSGATTGKFGVYKGRQRAFQNQRVGKFEIRNPDALDHKFLLYQLFALKRQIEKGAYGGAQPNISSKKIEEMAIVVPEIDIQRAIVSKIEELFSELDKGIENLKAAQEQLRTYRQSVLKWAFEGRLTNEDLSKGKLPEGWTIVALASTGQISGGLTKNEKRKTLAAKRPFLRVANVYMNLLDLSEVHEIGISEAELERVLLQKDDLLFVEGNGSIDHIGRVALWTGEIKDCVHQNHLIKVRLNKGLLPKFALYYFMSTEGRKSIKEKANSTSGLHTLSLSKVSSLQIVLPPLDEQQKIVDEIQFRFSITYNMEQSINDSLQQAEALRQSILRKAFEGGLVNI